MESRISELTDKLSQTSRDQSDTVRMQRSADKDARDAKMQLADSERHRAKLEGEIRNSEARMESMRHAMHELVSRLFVLS
jgi:myosin protein heavy chain